MMPTARALLLAFVGTVLAACDRATIVQPERRPPVTAASRTVVASVLAVTNVEQLYAAVNGPANAGAAIVLAPGTYVLSATSAGGGARPNGGRLELQPDMSLSGVSDDRSAVVIDFSALPASSFNVLGKTSAIRIGRGSNSVQWLTIVGNSSSSAGVETDLVGAEPTQVAIAHVVAHANIRGIDVRNSGVAMNGRSIAVRIEDNDFFGGKEGIRVLNEAGVIGGRIDVTMSGNRSHDNNVGCIVEHNRASSGSLYVRSSGDHFEHNSLGCLIGGGLVNTVGAANSNTTVFEGHGDAFIDNTFVVNGATDAGGMVVIGAETPNAPNSASHNSVTVQLWGTMVSGNQKADLQTFGARNTGNPPGISGVDNRTMIELHGVSKQIDVVAVNSLPLDPTGTNTVTIVR
ncbi:MAG TPA: hypothetical protein VL308_24325 [Gemmatimonadaceae bacterium]|jgi:hypothetical protein|nr:hypothetical protein [Gemmatimonadaceae bacterium]